ncbi:hypothetical protein JW835_15275 [bacterium]|nr:hypothetical protein [bacterium]
MKTIDHRSLTFITLLCTATMLFSQGRPYDGPDDPAGDRALVRRGIMDGNRVRLQFRNTTELSDWGTGADPFASKWPNTLDGVKMSDGIGLLIAARVYLKQDTIPVDDWTTIQNWNTAQQGTLDTLYFLQTSYREEMDYNAEGDISYGLYPVYGYFNEGASNMDESPAISDDPDSWPQSGWPAKNGLLYPPMLDEEGELQRYFHGRFGRGTEEAPSKADLECFFVANDAQDQEYFEDTFPTAYYPRDGEQIGDRYPGISIGYGKPWGGIGIRVAQRGYQWRAVEAQDAIFWEYNIANTSKYDINEVAFGYWVDNGIGGTDGDDELGAFDARIDLAYSWDIDGLGVGSFRTGTMGFAYLESPGIYDDGIDNDTDGLTDERRDKPAEWADPAGSWVGPEHGITNMTWFLETYRKKPDELKEHWEGDEDQDWRPFSDDNGNGVWDEGEYAGDDVGIDGFGPNERGWSSELKDEGECDGKPSYKNDNECEPNFNAMDISESDMLGLTAFQMFPISERTKLTTSGGDGSGYHWFFGDQSMFQVMTKDSLQELSGETTQNLVEVFASGIFPLRQGQTERISMAEIHSYDPLEGLNSDDHLAPALFKQKEVVQIIYGRDYQFTKAPLRPTLNAVAMDGRVVLTWDDASDRFTTEPLLNNINDFEGYKLMKATDKLFSEAETITDGYGNPKFKTAIFQCDVKDGITGYTDYNLDKTGGQGFYLGDDTGLQHFYIDDEVQNGVTYYYGLVAYDYGIHPDSLRLDEAAAEEGLQEIVGFLPSITDAVPELDQNDNFVSIPSNMVIVTPGADAAGRTVTDSTWVDENETAFRGTGTIAPDIIMPDSMRIGSTYEVEFSNYIIRKKNSQYWDYGVNYVANGLRVYRNKNGERHLIYEDVAALDEEGEPTKPTKYSTVLTDGRSIEEIGTYFINTSGRYTGLFDGMRLYVQDDVGTPELDRRIDIGTGWYPRKDPDIPVDVILDDDYIYYAWDYRIRFLNEDEEMYQPRYGRGAIYDVNNEKIDTDYMVTDAIIPFIVENMSHVDSTRFEISNGDTTYLPELMEVVILKENIDSVGIVDLARDRIIVGCLRPESDRWADGIFELDFVGDSLLIQPQPGDVFWVKFRRPFWKDDKFVFSIESTQSESKTAVKQDMNKIKVVPNPYVATNLMEPALQYSTLNQKRRIMFTHVPEKCTIKIFTISGVFVDEIQVPEDGLVSYGGLGDSATGIIHWDLRSHEGLEIAAGVYVFHVKDRETGLEKIGKFAVIK